ncbi:MAG TPA: hypothetical protein VHX14_16745, partial [Thermoanaerobaculia bacterium]|nr:hypothetical protein [Thermoanaerobaculia bacterium]
PHRRVAALLALFLAVEADVQTIVRTGPRRSAPRAPTAEVRSTARSCLAKEADISITGKGPRLEKE